MFNSLGYHERSQTAKQDIISVWEFFFPRHGNSSIDLEAFLLDALKL